MGPTCSTMGSCSGGRRRWEPASSHSSKARSCSAKKGLGLKSASGCALSSSLRRRHRVPRPLHAAGPGKAEGTAEARTVAERSVFR